MPTTSASLMVSHANCLPVGTVLGDFEIIGLIGEGGFGIVYMARDTSLDRLVALKEFMPAAFAGRVGALSVSVRSANHRATFEAGLRSFINEAKLLAQFAHPALVEVYRFWEANGTAYMAMRFYPGETLRQHLTKGDTVFDEAFIARTMAPIFNALEMLHRAQVFHRDIAPDNIIITDGKPVLLDFGSARRIVGDATQALTTILKPGYAPIEQYVDDGTMRQGPWTDVYALGGVLYHLATGKVPIQAVSRLLSDPLPRVNHATQNAFSAGFSEAVAKAMAVRVEDRLQTVTEFAQRLGWNTAPANGVLTQPGQPSARDAIREAEACMADSSAHRPATFDRSADLTSPKPSPEPGIIAQSRRNLLLLASAGVVALAAFYWSDFWHPTRAEPPLPPAFPLPATPDQAATANTMPGTEPRPAETSPPSMAAPIRDARAGPQATQAHEISKATQAGSVGGSKQAVTPSRASTPTPTQAKTQTAPLIDELAAARQPLDLQQSEQKKQEGTQNVQQQGQNQLTDQRKELDQKNAEIEAKNKLIAELKQGKLDQEPHPAKPPPAVASNPANAKGKNAWIPSPL